MKKHILSLSLIFMVSLFAGCDSKVKEVEQLESETIEIHDEVMPKMDDIMQLKADLKTIQDSVSSPDSAEIEELIISLENSDKAMMNWMRNYDPRMENMSESEKIAYLRKQKAAIKEVSEQMKSSISEAEAYLNQ